MCVTSAQALLDAHDDIAAKNYDPMTDEDVFQVFTPPSPAAAPLGGGVTDAVRMVGIRKSADEPLVSFHDFSFRILERGFYEVLVFSTFVIFTGYKTCKNSFLTCLFCIYFVNFLTFTIRR